MKSTAVVNDVVMACYKGSETKYRGKSTGINEDGTFEVLFDDGDIEDVACLVRTRGVGVHHDVGSDLTSIDGPFLDDLLEGTVLCRLDSSVGNEGVL